MVHVASIVGALSGCRGMAWFSRLCVRLTGLSQLRHGKIPFSHMEGVPTLCPEIPIYTPGRFAFPFLILFLAYIGACADWRGSPALSKALEAVGGKGLGWVCSGFDAHTVRDGALEIAYKKFTGDFGLDFLGHLRNQVGGPQGPDF